VDNDYWNRYDRNLKIARNVSPKYALNACKTLILAEDANQKGEMHRDLDIFTHQIIAYWILAEIKVKRMMANSTCRIIKKYINEPRATMLLNEQRRMLHQDLKETRARLDEDILNCIELPKARVDGTGYAVCAICNPNGIEHRTNFGTSVIEFSSPEGRHIILRERPST